MLTAHSPTPSAPDVSNLCGWLDWSQSDIAGRRAAGTRTTMTPWGSRIVSSNDIDVFKDDHRLVSVWGQVRFKDAGLARLARQRGAARALAEGHAKAGAGILQSLEGAFALAILRPGGRALLAVDRSGICPLYFTVNAGKLVFGSSLDAIAGAPGSILQTSRQAIYEYVYFHTVPGPRTIYENCERLLPGTFVTFDAGELKKAPYWEMKFTEDDRRPLRQLRENFRRVLHDSVADSMRNGGRTGAFLSGGTDSSTVAGMMRQVTGEPPRTYSIGFDASGYDEMAYARIAARHFGAEHHEYYVTPQDVVDAIPRIARAHDQPFGNSSAVPTYYCARLAQEDGIQTMLGGDGGDELFGGNERYAKQYLYSLYSDLPRVIRKTLVEPVMFSLPEGIALFGKGQRYIRNASAAMPARYDNYNLLERLGPSAVFAPAFLDGVDQTIPAAQMADAYWSQQASSMVNRMLGLDLKYTLADNDLPKVMRACALAGVEVRFPMLDDRLVAFAAGLPSGLKLKGTRLRYFFKEALRDFLPREVIEKKKHGFGMPFGPWLMKHEPLRQLAFDSLNDLKQRGIVRRNFVDELCSRHVAAHAHYYGTMVWILMMLEQWFKQSRSGRAT